MKIAIYLTLVIICIVPLDSYSCINEYRAKLDGSIIMSDGGFEIYSPRFDSLSLLKDLKQLDSDYKKTGRLEYFSDYGVILVRLGRFSEAKEVFLVIEKKNPNLYNTAANIGTVYELLGEVDSALIWIKKAVRINPESHSGSEWIHVKILESKKAATRYPDYYNTHNILNIDFGKARKPLLESTVKAKELQAQLYYQLRERISFVKPKDPIVAQLLFDLGNVTAIVNDVKSALSIYDLAKEYGYTSELFNKRTAYFEKLQRKADIKNRKADIKSTIAKVREELKISGLHLVIIVTLFIGTITALFLYIRRRKS